jgi:hypothetical protein
LLPDAIDLLQSIKRAAAAVVGVASSGSAHRRRAP